MIRTERPGRAMRQRNPFLFGQVPRVAGRGSANEVLIGALASADFNSTADQAIALSAGLWRITKIQTTNASLSMTTAAGGFYTAAAKGGTAVVAAAQVYTGMVLAADVVSCTIAKSVNVATPFYFALTTAQGAAATADISVYGVGV